MVEILKKSEFGDKIARVNSIRMISIYYNFIRCWGPLWSREIFRAQSIYREVYGCA